MNDVELAREHLQDLLGSDAFKSAPVLSRLLVRLVQPCLAGQSEAIKEQILGIEVFDRRPDWNPQNDSIVRVEVNRLRLTLQSHYGGLTPEPRVRFEVPKGRYLARFIVSPKADPEGDTSSGKQFRQHNSDSLASSPNRQQLPGLSLQRLTYERGDVTNAAFCPDGESVVFSARWREEPITLRSQRIGQKYSRPLGLPPGELCDVSTTGQILFTLGQGSFGMLAQAELSGGPHREIVDGVCDAVWLPDDQSIAAARMDCGVVRVELPLGNPVHRLSGKQSRVRLTCDPSGERVAFIDNSLGPLDYCAADGNGNVQRLTRGWRLTGGIQWLRPDKLVVSGARRGAPAIHELDLDGNEQSIYPSPIVWNLHDSLASGRLLASCVDSRLHVAFRGPSMASEEPLLSMTNARVVGLSPDARFALLSDPLGGGIDRNSPVLLTSLPGGQPVQIGEGDHPALSPDGKRAVFVERRESGAAIVITPIPSGLPSRHSIEPTVKCHSAEFIGKTDRLLVQVLNDQGQLESHIFEPELKRLSPVPGCHHVTLVAPDERWAVIRGGSELRLLNLETGDTRSICAMNAGWAPLRWATSGHEIFVYEPGNTYNSAAILRVNVDSGEQCPWLTLHPADSAGVYLLPWVDVTPDGRSYAYTYQQDLSDLYIIDGLI